MENIDKGHIYYFNTEHIITIQYKHYELYNLNNKVNYLTSTHSREISNVPRVQEEFRRMIQIK